VDERGELCKSIYGNFAANLEIYYQDFFSLELNVTDKVIDSDTVLEDDNH
jgi:hypothetical protein